MYNGTTKIKLDKNLILFYLDGEILYIKKPKDHVTIEFANGVKIITRRDYKGNLHSYNDKPSLIMGDGTKKWHKHGHLHRNCGPAIIFSNGTELFYKEGMFIK